MNGHSRAPFGAADPPHQHATTDPAAPADPTGRAPHFRAVEPG
ncbi:hypothetical protein [Nocardia seriolae]|nr:hypothetical protein [Nocardia seriolae]WNJ60238.1 hypothetical protein RMO66_05420 [Nocardia seriolae]BAW09838.1 hypothetical protein NSERUTF1_6774 [Nocardia seriolae]